MSGGRFVRGLHEVPSVLPLLVDWYERTWAPWYGPGGGGEGQAQGDLMAALEAGGRGELPLCLVAVQGSGEVLGTACLRRRSVSHDELGPWVTGVIVAEGRREGGEVGEALLVAAELAARQLGFGELYMSAGGAEADQPESLLLGRGWARFDEAETLRGVVGVWRVVLV